MDNKTILCSACLLGIHCRYDGGDKRSVKAEELARVHTVIPVCPEQLGGLPTPRPPAELTAGRVFGQDGGDFTEAFRRGAEEVLRVARLAGATEAVLKSRSPSCGSGRVYDGSFSGTLVDGDGVTAALLKANGFRVRTEEEL